MKRSSKKVASFPRTSQRKSSKFPGGVGSGVGVEERVMSGTQDLERLPLRHLSFKTSPRSGNSRLTPNVEKVSQQTCHGVPERGVRKRGRHTCSMPCEAGINEATLQMESLRGQMTHL